MICGGVIEEVSQGPKLGKRAFNVAFEISVPSLASYFTNPLPRFAHTEQSSSSQAWQRCEQRKTGRVVRALLQLQYKFHATAPSVYKRLLPQPHLNAFTSPGKLILPRPVAGSHPFLLGKPNGES